MRDLQGYLCLALVVSLALMLLGMGIEAAAFKSANAGRYSDTGALIGWEMAR